MSESHLCGHGYVYGCAECRNTRRRPLVAPAGVPEPQGWQEIETAPKDGTYIIGALIRDGKVWRVHDMRHNGLAFYTTAGGSLPQMTHWMPLPPSDGRPSEVAVGRLPALDRLNAFIADLDSGSWAERNMADSHTCFLIADELEAVVAGLRADPAPPGGP